MPDINQNADLVRRLQERAELNLAWDKWELGDKPVPPPLLHAETARHLSEAADAIESLSRHLEEAREALKPFAEFIGNDTRMPDTMPLTAGSAIAKPQVTVADFRRARSALEANHGRS